MVRHLTQTSVLALAFAALAFAGCDTADSSEEAPPSPWLPRVVIAPADTSGVNAEDLAGFREDATRLALRHVHGLVDYGLATADEPVGIPPELVEHFFNGLVHIYNATELPQRDSVFTIIDPFRIRTTPYPSTREFYVGVLCDAGWIGSWEDGEPLTGNPAVDTLMTRYSLSVQRRSCTREMTYFVLNSPVPLNARVLAEQFQRVEGVSDAEAVPWIPGARRNEITARSTFQGTEFSFSLGWDDCPSGCISYHLWTFLVEERGTVRFLVSNGDEIPVYFYSS